MKIKIAVVIDTKGKWSAVGWGGPGKMTKDDFEQMMDSAIDSVDDGEKRYWVEAEIDPPKEITVAGMTIDEA